MITWLFDRRNKYGYIPNLVKDTTLQPGTSAWWDLCVKSPYSYEFRFLKYCGIDKIKYRTALVNDEDWEQPAYYPINLNFWDTGVDYFSHMDPESLEKLKRGKFRVLFYYSEGDDPSIEILPHLRWMLKRHGLSPDAVRIVTANWNVREKAPFVFFPDDELYYRYLHITGPKNYITEHSLEKRSKKLTCLIRADKPWRRLFASQFFDMGLDAESYFSYVNYQYETTSVQEETEFVREALTNEQTREALSNFELHLPIRADDLNDQDHNNHKLINKKFFNDAYWNFVVETHFEQNTCFLTEKTFKPILNLQPFVIAGNPGSLDLLRYLGYRTFGDVLHEQYDQTANHHERMAAVLKTAHQLHNSSDEDHIDVQEAIHSTLVHNQNHFLAPKTTRIKNLLNQLDYHG